MAYKIIDRKRARYRCERCKGETTIPDEFVSTCTICCCYVPMTFLGTVPMPATPGQGSDQHG